jgi:tRNA-2-methylthio-N6-dimethylallyladenosine synthase
VTRTYVVRTFGCQMNEHDSERLAGVLEADGYARADHERDADVIVLNTCCIRENADNKLYGNLGHLKRLKDERPGTQIVVAGCLAQKDREVVRARAPWVDVVMGTFNVHRVGDLLTEAAAHGAVVEVLDRAVEDDHDRFPSALPVVRDVEHAAWVTIQIGCDNTCAFCIVPAVRGPEISRPVASILDEVRELAARGVVEVTLLGQNVNSYGRDLALVERRADGRTPIRPWFADLLRSVAGIDGIERVRYTSPHPKDLRPETIVAMAESAAVCEHLHLPLQSGSDAVLAAMHRGYTAERYLARLGAARAAIGDLAVSTDLIVGFPGESDRDAEDTLAVVAEAGFDSAYTFIYSPRPGTEAAALADRFVDPAVVAHRFERLRAVVERSALLRHEARVGRVEEVLVDGPSKRDAGVVSGRTRQNKLVHIPADRPLVAGTIVRAEITSAAPHFLRARLTEVIASSRVRRRIPVTAG